MSTVPAKTADRITWYENRNSTWFANAVAIGTSTTTVAALGSLTLSARNAYNAQQVAQDTAKSATITLHDSMQALQSAGSDVIKQIKTKASIVGGNSIYALADIPSPATPTPVGPPGMPTNFVATINPDGSLYFKWKCANPTGSTGTTYQILRQANGETGFTFVGSTGNKFFTDSTLPADSAPLTYKITAVRSTSQGTPNEFTVKFGLSGGTMTASVVAAPRMAA